MALIWKRILRGCGIGLLIYSAIVGGLIAFGTAKPPQVFVGGTDELIDAEKLKTEFQSQRSDVPVTIIPGLGHSDMVTQSDAIRALVAAFK